MTIKQKRWVKMFCKKHPPDRYKWWGTYINFAYFCKFKELPNWDDYDEGFK
jgi:hypothetical protein